jgi:hypothetical protein
LKAEIDTALNAGKLGGRSSANSKRKKAKKKA